MEDSAQALSITSYISLNLKSKMGEHDILTPPPHPRMLPWSLVSPGGGSFSGTALHHQPMGGPGPPSPSFLSCLQSAFLHLPHALSVPIYLLGFLVAKRLSTAQPSSQQRGSRRGMVLFPGRGRSGQVKAPAGCVCGWSLPLPQQKLQRKERG